MKRVLFVNPFGIGDAIFTLSSVEKFRAENPGAFVGFVGNERTVELLQLYPVDRVHVFNRDALRAELKRSPFRYWAAVRRLVAEVRRENYDTLVDFSLGREFSLAGLLAGVPRRIGFDFRGRGFFLTFKRRLDGYEGMSVAARQLRLLVDAGLVSDDRLPGRLSFAGTAPVDVEGDLLAVAPGGGRSWGENASYKQWDAALFAEAVRGILAARPRLCVALLGDEAERPILEAVKKGVGGAGVVMVLAGEPLSRAAAILRRAKLFIGNDGGLAHLAAAFGTPTLTIFGPVDERAYAPPGGRTVTAPVECRPCYGSFRFPPCTHERACLVRISPDKVIEPALEIL